MRARRNAASLRIDVVDVRFEHRLDGAPGALMHAVVELEVADREFRLPMWY